MWLPTLQALKPVRNTLVLHEMTINKKHFFDLRVPFFIPLWRRIAVVAVSLCWAVFEFATGAPFWGFVFVAMGFFAAWELLLSGWPDDGKPE